MKGNNEKDIKVSICCLTYNHGEYIEACLKAFLKQKTTFPFEVLIHDDASTDRTAKIIEEYEKRFPSIIKPIYQKENKFSKEGGGMNIRYNFPRANGKYIALCEGDDYWTDPLKLQKQVDFLEGNEDFVLCFHDADVLEEKNKSIAGSYLKPSIKKELSQDELKKGANILPLTLCFRNVLKGFPDEFFKILNGDTFLISLLGTYGKGFYQEDIKNAIYRHHTGGIWSLKKENIKILNRLTTYHYLRVFYKRIQENEIYYYFNEKFVETALGLLKEIKNNRLSLEIIKCFWKHHQFRTVLWFGFYKMVFQTTGRGNFARRRLIKSFNLNQF